MNDIEMQFNNSISNLCINTWKEEDNAVEENCVSFWEYLRIFIYRETIKIVGTNLNSYANKDFSIWNWNLNQREHGR